MSKTWTSTRGWSQLAWLPQHPVLLPGTVRENLDLTGVVDAQALTHAAAATGFDAVLAELPAGVETVIGVGGTGLSLGGSGNGWH